MIPPCKNQRFLMFLNDPLIRQDPSIEEPIDIQNILQKVNRIGQYDSQNSLQQQNTQQKLIADSSSNRFSTNTNNMQIKELMAKVDGFYAKFNSMESKSGELLIKLNKEAENMDNDEMKLSKMMQNLMDRFQNIGSYMQKLDQMKGEINEFQNLVKILDKKNKKSSVINNETKDTKNITTKLSINETTKDLMILLENVTRERDTYSVEKEDLKAENIKLKDQVYYLKKNIENQSLEIERLKSKSKIESDPIVKNLKQEITRLTEENRSLHAELTELKRNMGQIKQKATDKRKKSFSEPPDEEASPNVPINEDESTTFNSSINIGLKTPDTKNLANFSISFANIAANLMGMHGTAASNPKLKDHPEDIFTLKKKIFDLECESNEKSKKLMDISVEIENKKAIILEKDQRYLILESQYKQLAQKNDFINTPPQREIRSRSPLHRSYIEDDIQNMSMNNRSFQHINNTSISMDIESRRSLLFNEKVIFSDQRKDNGKLLPSLGITSNMDRVITPTNKLNTSNLNSSMLDRKPGFQRKISYAIKLNGNTLRRKYILEQIGFDKESNINILYQEE